MINVVNTQQSESESHPERVLNIKQFINKFSWKGMSYPSKIDDWKLLRKIILQWLVTFSILKKNKYILVISGFQAKKKKDYSIIL